MTTFARDEQKMLVIALTAQKLGKSPCEHLGITDPKLVWEMEIACAHRLVFYENQREKDRAELNNLAFITAQAGQLLNFDKSEETDLSEIPEG